jgi:hypothetical protein
MAKIAELRKGDRVRWGTSQGKTTGTVVGIRTKPFSIKGTELKASKDDPKVVVESEKTGAQAGHKPSALSKLKARATGKDGGGGTSKAKDAKAKDEAKQAKAKDAKAKQAKAKEAKAKDAKAKDAKAKDAKGTKAKGKAAATGKGKG